MKINNKYLNGRSSLFIDTQNRVSHYNNLLIVQPQIKNKNSKQFSPKSRKNKLKHMSIQYQNTKLVQRLKSIMNRKRINRPRTAKKTVKSNFKQQQSFVQIYRQNAKLYQRIVQAGPKIQNRLKRSSGTPKSHLNIVIDRGMEHNYFQLRRASLTNKSYAQWMECKSCKQNNSIQNRSCKSKVRFNTICDQLQK